MTHSRQHYRKKLASGGFIFLAGVEQEIVILNISITGLFVELSAKEGTQDIKQLFVSIRDSNSVDLIIPDMRLAAEAEVVRADKVDDLIYLGLEFKNVSYDVEDFLYKRKYYRKKMAGLGHIDFAEQTYQFSTCNVSVEGLMIRIDETVEVENGVIAKFDFPKMNLSGKVEVVWIEFEKNGNTLLGLQYLQMEKMTVTGIPAFAK